MRPRGDSATPRMGGSGPPQPPPLPSPLLLLLAMLLSPRAVTADCWIVESDRNLVPRAICSENTPPFDAVPRGLNASVADLRVDRNRIREIPRSALATYPRLLRLDLSYNHIALVHDRAFEAQARLRVLLLGHNRLEAVSPLTFAGLLQLRELHLEANRLRRVAPLAFRQSVALASLDLSGNRLPGLEAAALLGPHRLDSLGLLGNPLHCGCEMRGLLLWMSARINSSSLSAVSSLSFLSTSSSSSSSPHSSSPSSLSSSPSSLSSPEEASPARGPASWMFLSCSSPRDMRGVPLLPVLGGAPRSHRRRSALYELSTCGVLSPPTETPSRGPSSTGTPRPGLGGGRGEEEEEAAFELGSGMDPAAAGPRSPTPAGPDSRRALPSLKLVSRARTSAVLRVQIPHPFGKMYALARYNRSAFSVVRNLRRTQEEVRLDGLSAQRLYTYCVVSIRQAEHTRHACLDFHTLEGPAGAPSEARAARARRTIALLGCGLGFLLLLLAAGLALRRRLRGARRGAADGAGAPGDGAGTASKCGLAKAGDAEKAAAGGGLDPQPPAGSAADAKADEARDAGGGPVAAKHSYMEVQVAQEALPKVCGDLGGAAERRGSAAEISTIAKEVDRVNLIINSCIDALRADAPPCGGPPPVTADTHPEPHPHGPLGPLVNLGPLGPQGFQGFQGPTTPPSARGPYSPAVGCGHVEVALGPRRSRGGTEVPPEGPGSSGTQGGLADTGPRVAGSGRGGRPALRAPPSGPHEAARPLPLGPLGPPGPSAGRQRAPCSEVEALGGGAVTRSPGSPPPCRPGLRRGAGGRAYTSSPECGPAGPELRLSGPRGLWARLRRPLRRRAPWGPEMEPIAAGHALKRKVQLARHEDLHDILAYWKGVGAQRR